EVATGKELLALKGVSFTSLALSPDGRYLATDMSSGRAGDAPRGFGGFEDLLLRRVVLWDGGTGEEAVTWKESGAALTFSPDGSCLAAVQGSGTIVIWDAATGERQLTIAPPAGYSRSRGSLLAFSPDGKRLAMCGHDVDWGDVKPK